MKQTISKIEAAQCQLREAIRLWFHDGDLASMHVLACSALQIVADINAAQGGRDLIYDSLVVKDEYRREWSHKFKSAYNHLKHADKNPDPSFPIELDTELTEFFILFTCLGLEGMKAVRGAIESAFQVYYMVAHPELVREGTDPFHGIPSESVEAARRVPKELFFEAYLSASGQTGRG